MRCGAASFIILALFVSSLGDYAARSQASACNLAPCCVGKTATCPMHHGEDSATKMRSCSSDDHSAMMPLAILPASHVERASARPGGLKPALQITLASLRTPPRTPPPRHI